MRRDRLFQVKMEERLRHVSDTYLSFMSFMISWTRSCQVKTCSHDPRRQCAFMSAFSELCPTHRQSTAARALVETICCVP